MADYAGACAAIKAKFVAEWVVGDQPRTPVTYPNGPACKQVGEDGNPCPWVAFEIVHAGNSINGSGTIGQQTKVRDGLIKVHVFTPTKAGDEAGLALALLAESIFANKVFYDATPGFYVRSGYEKNGQPRTDDGDLQAEDGEWFAHTATIPFEYWHRG